MLTREAQGGGTLNCGEPSNLCDGGLETPIPCYDMFMVRYDWLFPPLAAVSLIVELGSPLALLHRRIAYVWCAVAWSFHVGVLAVMWIVFHYPLLGLA